MTGDQKQTKGLTRGAGAPATCPRCQALRGGGLPLPSPGISPECVQRPRQTQQGGRTQGTRAVPGGRLETLSRLEFRVRHVEAADDRLC